MFLFCNEKTPHLCGFQVFRKHLYYNSLTGELKEQQYGLYSGTNDDTKWWEPKLFSFDETKEYEVNVYEFPLIRQEMKQLSGKQRRQRLLMPEPRDMEVQNAGGPRPDWKIL